MLGPNAFSQTSPGPLFGPEFTFFSDMTMKDNLQPLQRMVERAQAHLIDGQLNGAKFVFDQPKNYLYIFESPNGWIFDLSPDPGVIEATTSPMTVGQFEKFEADIQDAIFATAANEGLFPGLFVGGGHISIDASYLYKRPLVFRNFLADLLVNHVELFLGVFGYDTNNAPPLIMLDPLLRKYVTEAFERFDSVKNPSRETILNLVTDLEVAKSKFPRDPYQRYWDKKKNGHDSYVVRSEKYVAVSFYSINLGEHARLELRAVRPQVSMNVWIRQIRLLKKRIDYLETLKKPIPLDFKYDLYSRTVKKAVAREHAALNPPISAEEALLNFQVFVEESGEKIENHLDYVWPEWITSGEVEQFKSGLHQSQSKACELLLRLNSANP